MHSIKTKLVLAISLFILVLLSITAFLFIREKSQELTNDIFVNARNFAELTAENIVNDYNLYLSQKSFVYFNRDISELFQKNLDISAIQLYRYNGELVYDSRTEKEKQYEGPPRDVKGTLLEELQAKNPSVVTLEDSKIAYLKKDAAGSISIVDQDEKPLPPLQKDQKILSLVQPASNDFSIVYFISYRALADRINQTTFRIALLAVFGVGLGIFLAILYATHITRPVQKLTEGARVIATGNFKARVEVKGKDEIHTLADAFNKMAVDLEISTKALVYKERVAKELELAAKIQKQLLPKIMPEIASLDISAGLLPAEEIGGDLYDFIQTDANNLLMYIGDVTGHGVPSGIVVSIANAVIYNLAGKKDIKSLLVDANHVLKEKTSSNMFMTVVMLNWNEQNKKFQYVNAGHEQIIHFHAKDKKVTLLPPGGLALGMFPDISKNLKQEEILVEKDDVLVLYSDGIPESWKDEKEMYGMVRFKRAISEYADLPTALAIRNAILADVKDFAGKYKQMDDITLIVLKRR